MSLEDFPATIARLESPSNTLDIRRRHAPTSAFAAIGYRPCGGSQMVAAPTSGHQTQGTHSRPVGVFANGCCATHSYRAHTLDRHSYRRSFTLCQSGLRSGYASAALLAPAPQSTTK